MIDQQYISFELESQQAVICKTYLDDNRTDWNGFRKPTKFVIDSIGNSRIHEILNKSADQLQHAYLP